MLHFMIIRLGEAELLHAGRRMDGRTDMAKLIVAFNNFAKAPNKQQIIRQHNVFFVLFVVILRITISLNVRSSIPDDSRASFIYVHTGNDSFSHVRGNGSKYD
jgi:hypothetical protein